MTYKISEAKGQLGNTEVTWQQIAKKILVEMLDWCGPRRERLKGSPEHYNKPAGSKETENFLITLAATLFSRINSSAL